MAQLHFDDDASFPFKHRGEDNIKVCVKAIVLLGFIWLTGGDSGGFLWSWRNSSSPTMEMKLFLDERLLASHALVFALCQDHLSNLIFYYNF